MAVSSGSTVPAFMRLVMQAVRQVQKSPFAFFKIRKGS
jgi:hypothetical protein